MIFIIIISLILTLAICCCISAGRAEKRERGKIKMTNFEKIKAMTVKEMVIAIDRQTAYCTHPDGCYDCLLHGKDKRMCSAWDIRNWLESEVQEDE